MTLPIADLGYKQSSEDGDLETQLCGTKPIIGTLGPECDSKDRSKQAKNAPKSKKPKLENPKVEDCGPLSNDGADVDTQVEKGAQSISQQNQTNTKAALTFKSSMPSLNMAAHTGYLTFATLCPN